MFRFEKEQTIVEIGKVKFGGQPGELPTPLAGTIFYKGHRIITDPKSGEFDRATAESLLKRQEELSEVTGVPQLVQVFAEAPEVMIKYLDFASSYTDAPFLIDSTDASTRLQGAKYVAEIGLRDRAVFNSVNVSITEQEIAVLRETKLPAIVLAFNPKDQTTVKGRMEVMTTGAGLMERGLLDIAREFTEKILIDVAATALGLGAGPSERATYVMKAKFGLPVGTGIHNAVSAWTWLKKYKKQIPEGKDVYRVCDISSSVVHVMCGGDFILYGPIENAPYIFPTVAFANTMVAEAVKEALGTKPAESHPINKLC